MNDPITTAEDRKAERDIAARENDWRCGPIIYQAIVDRFAPPSPQSLAAKQDAGLYDAPRTLRDWSEPARRGKRIEGHTFWSHEADFWGGDLASLASRLDHLESLGVQVLYLNPIHDAATNHKYDAKDWRTISPEYGTREDLKNLAADLKTRGIHLMLDGVFNHMGSNAPIFQEALADPNSKWRDWFFFSDDFEHGYRGWFGSQNLPEVRLENPETRAAAWTAPDSAVRGFIADGIDGWRIDVAYDYGLTLLADLRKSAQAEKPDAWVVGEVWNYPEQWVTGEDPALDGVMNMYARRLIMEFLDAKISGPRMGRLLHQMIEDMGIEPALRSWLVLDNHDTPRLKTMFPREADRRLAQILQLTLPGAPVIYYGVEAGMVGNQDPEMRGPMDWAALEGDTPELDRLTQLLAIRNSLTALRVGDFRSIESERLLAFQRRTGRALETATVLINPSPLPISELISLRDSRFMNAMPLRDALTGDEVWSHTGTVEATVPARGAMILTPTDDPNLKGGYSPYKRIR